VVGAGVAGLAAAARLAKLRHDVVVLERRACVGGAMGRLDDGGFSWDSGPTSTLLPAVLRDLFRKSGRPLERYLDLQLRAVARRHVFADGAVVDLPTASRAAQTRAVDAGLGAGAGAAWTAFVDAQADLWQSLRVRVLDEPDGGSRLGERAVAASLGGSRSLARALQRGLPDERLRRMAGVSFELAGSSLRDVPAFAAVEAYVERTFGVWRPGGGMADVRDALAVRLGERGVEVRLETPVVRLLWDAGQCRVTGAAAADGEIVHADVVVAAVDPRRVFGELLDASAAPKARRAFEKAMPAMPPAIAHLGLAGDVPALPEEVVLHGDPLLAVHTGGQAPAGHHAWTVHRRGTAAEDVLVSLARRGIDVRDQVVVRVDRSPSDVIGEAGGSPYGIAWDGYRAYARRAALTAPAPGLYLVGAGVHPGAGVAFAAWGAAHVAARIGRA
jgi:phytoene dehydrogenase-like protein